MKIAILSDIHGNYEALLSVLKDIEQIKPAHIFCTGDLVSYGPEPDKVVKHIINLKIPSVIGNHDYAVFHPEKKEWFNEIAWRSIEITRDLLSEQSLEFLSSLPLYLTFENIYIVHGTPPDSFENYIHDLPTYEIAGFFLQFTQDIAFVGHSHRLRYYEFTGKTSIENSLKEITTLKRGSRYIVNGGSVGQPRDGNRCAKYVIFDTEAYSIEVRYVEYDINKTVQLIYKLGFPRLNAERLL